MEAGQNGVSGVPVQYLVEVALRHDFVTVQILFQLTVAYIVQHLLKTRGIVSTMGFVMLVRTLSLISFFGLCLFQ